MAIIIAAHAGAGKSYAAKMNSSVFTDLTYYMYRYEVPDGYVYDDDEDSESIKASFRFPENENYPENYLDAIKTAAKDNKIIFIVPDPHILSQLRTEGIPYLLIYPVRSAREEYRQRFIKRGNKDNFMKIFIGRWDSFIDAFERDTYGRHIVLQPHQYLSDVLNESLLSKNIDEIGEESTWRVFTHEDAEMLTGEHIIIPSGYDEIGECAFNWREDIKSVTVPEGVSYIADSAFTGLRLSRNLKKVVLPDSLKVIDIDAFADNEGLTDLTIGNGLRKIGTFAFSYCTGLKSVVLPDSLKQVNHGAFFGCKGLADGGVTYKGKTYGVTTEGNYCDVHTDFYMAANGED